MRNVPWLRNFLGFLKTVSGVVFVLMYLGFLAWVVVSDASVMSVMSRGVFIVEECYDGVGCVASWVL